MGKTTAKLKKTTKPARATKSKTAPRLGKNATTREAASEPLYYDSTPEYVRTTMEAMREHDRRVAADPSEARRFLIKMGLMTKGGKLTKRYGG